jgi:hemerythrin-like domain-containing protein
MAKKYRITDAEAAKVLIKNVNDRPNALATYGEAKMSPTQVKDLFDRQFLLVKEKHEALADVVEETEESIGEMTDRVSGLEDKIEDIGSDLEETDPTVPDWAKQPNKPAYTAEEVGAAEYYWVLDTFSGIQLEVNESGKKINAVSDEMNRQYVTLEILLSQLAERLNAVANSSDVDLDQLAEIVAYIKSNKTLIDAITTSKVNVTDIVDNLLTGVSNKPLSAKMGVELKRMIEEIQVPENNIPDWAMQPNKPSYSASEVGADEKGTADEKVGEHNLSDEAHNDIRLLISGLTDRLNALANSSDTDLDQLAEIVAYIKANKNLIDGITTNKVSVSDIIDNLTTNASNKPLSAKMGAELKKLIDAIKIPTSLPASDVYDWAKQPSKPSYSKDEVGLGNLDNVKQYSASNPPPYPVTSVNGQSGAVSLDASDVGAMPAGTKIPAKTSDITNDSGFIKSSEAPVQSVNGKTGAVTLAAGDVGARPSTWTPTYSDVGADKSGAASSAVSSHNTNTSAHNDMRLLIEELTTRLNALANSTDSDLDQMAEIVAYIKSNKTLIDSITSSKVSVADIVNNLTSNVANKPLSAAQGVALKALIDAIEIPTKLSQLTDDSSHRTVTDAEKTLWNAKIGQSDLQDATDAALAQAKASGEFKGDKGDKGDPGKTPVKGTDYFTSADKAEIAKQAANMVNLADAISLGIASDGLIYVFINGQPVGTGIPQGQIGDVFGYVDENNTIVLNGNLADGNYSVKYEKEDGSTVNIGDLVLSNGPVLAEFTNLFNPSTAILNKRISSSGELKDCAGCVSYGFATITNHVPFTEDTRFYVKGADFKNSNATIKFYKYTASDGGFSNIYSGPTASNITTTDVGNGVISAYVTTGNAPSSVKYAAFTLRVKDTDITSDDITNIIVTLNEPIYK